MVKVVASFRVKKDSLDEYMKLGKEVVEKTNALDEGCISYELCQNTEDPLGFVMLEAWSSQEALAAHMQSAHFQALVPKMDGLCEDGTTIALYNKLF